MPNPADSQYVDERLEELYRSHLLVGEEGVASYYESGRGYYKPELAAEERDRFSICIVRTNGEVHQAGDHDRPFALQSISKVFVYGLALTDHGRDYRGVPHGSPRSTGKGCPTVQDGSQVQGAARVASAEESGARTSREQMPNMW